MKGSTNNQPPPNDVMMTLGSGENLFQFSVSTAAYQSFRRSTQYRWQEQTRLHYHPMQQFLGQGTDTVDLEGVIYPHYGRLINQKYTDGLKQIHRMREIAQKGTPLGLVAIQYSEGENLGLWCVKNINENRTEFTAGGAPVKMDFSMSLVFYGAE